MSVLPRDPLEGVTVGFPADLAALLPPDLLAMLERFPPLMTEHEVVAATRLSNVTVWRLERAGQFPKRFRTAGKKVAWSRGEIAQWFAARLEARDPLPAEEVGA
jgi:predicted DNA-binding transcriptional regulator AlpA